MARPMTESNQKKRRSEYVSPVQWQKYLTFTLLCCINWTGKAFVNQGGPIVHFRSSEASPPFVLHAKTAGEILPENLSPESSV